VKKGPARSESTRGEKEKGYYFWVVERGYSFDFDREKKS